EYDRSFLQLEPTGAIITNFEADHLDYYGTVGALLEAFQTFAGNVDPSGLLVIGQDVPAEIENAARCPVWRLGRDFTVEQRRETHGFIHMVVRGPGFESPLVRLGVPGEFNMHNAALSLALVCGTLAKQPGREALAEDAGDGLRGFLGVERRFEPWGIHGGVEVVHDYAHHPTEVEATLLAARRALPGKPLHVLFQPHQESRTARFMDEFVKSFQGAETVTVSDVYGARKHIDSAGAGASELAERLRAEGQKAVHGGDLASSMESFLRLVPGGSGALVLGAGDVDLIRDDLIDNLALRGRTSS
ncbi:MAG: cyanophycin synthetase, partial [Planctomycetota bacterium]